MFNSAKSEFELKIREGIKGYSVGDQFTRANAIVTGLSAAGKIPPAAVGAVRDMADTIVRRQQTIHPII